MPLALKATISLFLLMHAEGDEHGDQRGERSELIDEIRNQEAEIVHDHDQEGNAVASDVVEKLEEGEGFKEQDENAHEDEQEVIEEAAEHVEIDDGVDGDCEAVAAGTDILGARRSPFSARARAALC